jgi:hypothetical protein
LVEVADVPEKNGLVVVETGTGSVVREGDDAFDALAFQEFATACKKPGFRI